MFWESHSNSPESLTVQFLQFIDWKTKDPPPPHFSDDILSVVGAADIVGLHLFTHILREYYFTECNVLTIELDLTDLSDQQQIDRIAANNQDERNKIITESVLIVTKLCSVICKMPHLKSLHLSLTNFPPQCYHPCIQMFNLGIDPSLKTKSKSNSNSMDHNESKDDTNNPLPMDHGGYLFSGGSDVFPCLQQLFLSPSIFYMNEENDNFIISTPITDYNDYNASGMVTSGYWSDDEEEHKSNTMKSGVNIQELMTEYDIASRQNAQSPNPNNSINPSWQCGICTLVNRHEFINCDACGEPKQLGVGNKGNMGQTPQNEPLFGGPDDIDEDIDDIDDEKLLTVEEDPKSPYFPFLSFLTQHNGLKSVSINIDKRGKNGISLMNRILLSMAKREHSLDSLYIDCGALHLHYLVRHLVLLIKCSSFKRISLSFNAMNERSVCRVISAFNAEPHRLLSFFSIHGTGVQTASQSVSKLVQFIEYHPDLEYLKLNYFSGISHIGDDWQSLMLSLLSLQSLTFLSFGEMLTDDNARMDALCQFVGKCTTLQTIDLSISQKSYEGHGGALENCKKFVFYTFKNQVFLQNQIEELSGILEVDQKMPYPIVELVVQFAFDIFGRFNININGLPEADMVGIGNQFMRLKQMKSRTWTTGRDLQLFTHL